MGEGEGQGCGCLKSKGLGVGVGKGALQGPSGLQPGPYSFVYKCKVAFSKLA